MATPLETAAALRQKLEALTSKNRALETILNQVAMSAMFEEPDALVLPEGMHLAPQNPKVVVSITVNGRGVRCRATYLEKHVTELGWSALLAQACMQPVGILANQMNPAEEEI